MQHSLLSLTLIAGLGVAAAVQAAEVKERIQSSSLSFSDGNGFTNAVLAITGPNGFEAEETAIRGLPIFRVQGAKRMVDGLYQYALTAASDERVPLSGNLNNGRGASAPTTALKPFSKYGTFQISRGTIVPADQVKSGADGDAAE